MNNEDDSNNFDTAAVRRAAEHRRAEDLAGWLGALRLKRRAMEEIRRRDVSRAPAKTDPGGLLHCWLSRQPGDLAV